MPTLPPIGALDVAEVIAERIGSYVDANFIQFLAADGDCVRCWYMNDSGEGPSFDIELRRGDNGWTLHLSELPPGTEPEIKAV